MFDLVNKVNLKQKKKVKKYLSFINFPTEFSNVSVFKLFKLLSDRDCGETKNINQLITSNESKKKKKKENRMNQSFNKKTNQVWKLKLSKTAIFFYRNTFFFCSVFILCDNLFSVVTDIFMFQQKNSFFMSIFNFQFSLLSYITIIRAFSFTIMRNDHRTIKKKKMRRMRRTKKKQLK